MSAEGFLKTIKSGNEEQRLFKYLLVLLGGVRIFAVAAYITAHHRYTSTGMYVNTTEVLNSTTLCTNEVFQEVPLSHYDVSISFLILGIFATLHLFVVWGLKFMTNRPLYSPALQILMSFEAIVIVVVAIVSPDSLSTLFGVTTAAWAFAGGCILVLCKPEQHPNPDAPAAPIGQEVEPAIYCAVVFSVILHFCFLAGAYASLILYSKNYYESLLIIFTMFAQMLGLLQRKYGYVKDTYVDQTRWKGSTRSIVCLFVSFVSLTIIAGRLALDSFDSGTFIGLSVSYWFFLILAVGIYFYSVRSGPYRHPSDNQGYQPEGDPSDQKMEIRGDSPKGPPENPRWCGFFHDAQEKIYTGSVRIKLFKSLVVLLEFIRILVCVVYFLGLTFENNGLYSEDDTGECGLVKPSDYFMSVAFLIIGVFACIQFFVIDVIGYAHFNGWVFVMDIGVSIEGILGGVASVFVVPKFAVLFGAVLAFSNVMWGVLVAFVCLHLQDQPPTKSDMEKTGKFFAEMFASTLHLVFLGVASYSLWVTQNEYYERVLVLFSMFGFVAALMYRMHTCEFPSPGARFSTTQMVIMAVAALCLFVITFVLDHKTREGLLAVGIVFWCLLLAAVSMHFARCCRK